MGTVFLTQFEVVALLIITLGRTSIPDPLIILSVFLQRKGFAFSQAIAFISGFNDVAIMTKPIQKSSGHFTATEDLRPFIKSEISGDNDRCFLMHL